VRRLVFCSGCSAHEMSDRIHRDKAGESVEPNKPSSSDANGSGNEDTFPKVSGSSAFSSAGLMEGNLDDDDDEGGGGGLMVHFNKGFPPPQFHY